jgi:thiamine-phosphate pyrophosphorylase
MILLPRLYAVADGTFGDPVTLATAILGGGARLVQIRHKEASSRTLIAEVEAILKIAPAGVRVIVNDRADIARIAGAAGVHLGQEDLQPEAARRVLSSDQIIGISTHNLSQAVDADRTSADYIAAGPIFPTTTKKGTAPVLGLEKLREICSHVRKPVVAIGGITFESAREVFECGAASVAVIGDLLRHDDVTARTREWVRCVEN